MQRLGLLLVLEGRIEVEPLEARLDLDLRHGETPDRQAGEEQVPVCGRDKARRGRYKR